MRMRGVAVAVLVAAGLSVTLTGAASAGEPDGDVLIVTCEDGEVIERRPTDEERRRLRAHPAPPERVRVERGDRAELRDRVERGERVVVPEGGVVRVVPAEPGGPRPDVACAEGAGAIEVLPAPRSAG